MAKERGVKLTVRKKVESNVHGFTISSFYDLPLAVYLFVEQQSP